MRARIAVPILLVLAMGSGPCATLSQSFQEQPRAQLAAAYTAFNGIVFELATLRAQGKFTRAQGDTISIVLNKCDTMLKQWESAINENNGDPVELHTVLAGFARSVSSTIVELQQMKTQEYWTAKEKSK